ncbi:MAG: alpha/beta hydrolase [Campylobacterota bacterium]|nr:alpha/beta hydrolase [Campylobacterota bacterium]
MNMKFILFLLLSVTFGFASHLIVKGGDATLLINGQEFKVPEDHNLTLQSGTMICFVDGSGRVIIDDKVKLSSKNPECYQIPLGDDTDIKALLSSIKDEAIITTKQKDDPASNRDIDRDKVIKGIISLPPSKREVVIYSEEYGPLPVTLSIKKPDGTVVKEIVNKESDKTLFRIPVNYLENDSKVEVTNAFGDKLVDQKVSSTLYYAMDRHSQVFYEKDKHTIVDILYGTDRKINSNRSDWESYYTGERGKLKYGVAQVSIPKEHKLGAMERPKFWESETIGEHVLITKLENIDGGKFLSLLKSKLTNVKEQDILIIIHGFNVTFAGAIRRTAQISYDLKFKGLPMAYSWPSQGEVNEYMRDESSVQYTVPHLVAFLKKVIDNRGDANIHIIGHSMGTRALTNALKEISYIYPGKHLFKNIILAAPDIDRDVFQVSLLPYITKTTDKITLYASSDDAALKLSNRLHSGERIGQGGEEDVFVYEGLDTIDASGIDTSLLGHSYFAEKEILMRDLKEVIAKSLPPTKRKSLIEKLKAKLAYWKFKFQTL